MQPVNEQVKGQHYRLLCFILLVSTALFSGSCSKKMAVVNYKHPEFHSEKKVIVQSADQYFINDIPKGEGSK
jgi:hypothetical protein